MTGAQQPDGQPDGIMIKVAWPIDVYDDATAANAFALSDMGEMYLFAFGFAPPPPNFDDIPVIDGEHTVAVKRPYAFVLPRSMLATMHQELGRLIGQNPQSFGYTHFEVRNEPPHAE